MPISDRQWQDLRDDVLYIKTRVDLLVTDEADHETRIRSLEKFKWSTPLTAILALLGLHFGQ